MRRLLVEEQWDSERVSRIRGSPKSWERDAGEYSHDIHLEGDEDHRDEVEFLPPATHQGEKKPMYHSKRDFNIHGYTDGCVGCRTIASGVQGRTGVPHSQGCRWRMEGIVQEQEPEMWARHVRKHWSRQEMQKRKQVSRPRQVPVQGLPRGIKQETLLRERGRTKKPCSEMTLTKMTVRAIQRSARTKEWIRNVGSVQSKRRSYRNGRRGDW
ncbi:hypothetical protein N9L68_06730 [bacterium]|nr:hypothetical protein [bacterium]